MRDAIDQHYADKGKYPASLDALVTDNYLRKIPEDPITRSADSWQTIPAEPDPSNPSAEPGISRRRSGADGTALDGTKYSGLEMTGQDSEFRSQNSESQSRVSSQKLSGRSRKSWQ